jgi:hypothetical protein
MQSVVMLNAVLASVFTLIAVAPFGLSRQGSLTEGEGLVRLITLFIW